ncbi:MAG TPA: HyaD/HybD family hydrogenase maturation endopeptidase [Dissulfurispiraceae bacterium]|nr:HyaD/HybD family hydrogenase maturation endopeptidase [Dissulfurispiraceae bacterium]
MPAALLGLGNVLMKDERIGVHVVNTIRERFNCPADLTIIDGGTLGLDLLPLFEDYDTMIIVDAVNFGREPGYIGALEGDRISAVLFAKLSAHEIGLADLISVARLKGCMPSRLCIIGMQPDIIDYELGLEMSKVVNANIEKIINLTIEKLEEWNIVCRLRVKTASTEYRVS